MNYPKILLFGALLFGGISLSFVSHAQEDDGRFFEEMIEALSSKKAITHAFRVTTTIEALGYSELYCGEGTLSLRGNQLSSKATPQSACQPGAEKAHQLDVKLYTTGAGNVVVMIHSTEDNWTRRLQNIQMSASAGEVIIEGEYRQDNVTEQYRIAIPTPGALASR
jgi:hypothetical protein